MQARNRMTCSLWTLFHMLAVGSGRRHVAGHRDAFGRVEAPPASPQQVMEAIRVFVQHFFGCADCRRHFLAEYDGCAYQRCVDISADSGYGGVVLWLWRMHNGVNKRLQAERHAAVAAVWGSGGGARPPPPSVRIALWPPESACAKCFKGRGHVAGVCSSATDPECWDERNVLAFFTQSYWDEAAWGALGGASAGTDSGGSRAWGSLRSL